METEEEMGWGEACQERVVGTGRMSGRDAEELGWDERLEEEKRERHRMDLCFIFVLHTRNPPIFSYQTRPSSNRS